MITSTGYRAFHSQKTRSDQRQEIVENFKCSLKGGCDPLTTLADKLLKSREEEKEAQEEKERQIHHYKTRCCGLFGSEHSNLVSACCMAIGAFIDFSGLTLDAIGTLNFEDQATKTAITVAAVALFFFGTTALIIGIIMRCAGLDAINRINDLSSPELSNTELKDIRRLFEYLDSVAKLNKQTEDYEEHLALLGKQVSALPQECCGITLHETKEELVDLALRNLDPTHPLRKNLALFEDVTQRKSSDSQEPSTPPFLDSTDQDGSLTLLNEVRDGINTKAEREEGVPIYEGDLRRLVWKQIEKGLGFDLSSIQGTPRSKIFS